MNGLPRILAERRGENSVELDIEVPLDSPWFEGHFDGMAILPGVVQIGWAAHYAGVFYRLGPDIRALEQIKFRRPISPGARLSLQIMADPATGKARYEYRDADASYSSGTLNFGNPA
ncbi:MAG: hypothetical protein ACM3ZT_11760 [Bacillota bacterium]